VWSTARLIGNDVGPTEMAFSVEARFIDEAERKLGVRFPETYRQKMQTESGGHVSTPPDGWDLHPFFDKSDKKRLKRTANHIIRETEISRRWSGWPERAIAIGENGAGDRLIFLRSEEDPARCDDALYWWDHETGTIHLITKDLDRIFETPKQ